MNQSQTVPTFSLMGGPLYRFASRLGLLGDGTKTVLFGVALGVGLWLVLVLLSLFDGSSEQVFSLAMIAGHVRLLVVIPLFFLCEDLLAPSVAKFVDNLVGAGIVHGSALSTLSAQITRIQRWNRSWLPELLGLLMTVALTWFSPTLPLPGISASYVVSPSEMTLSALWYWFICMTMFRFLIFRWLWQLGLWYFLLWRIVRLDLRLIPTHSDGAAGLGFLEVVQLQFLPLIFGLSALQCASFAEEIVSGTMLFVGIYAELILTLLIQVLLFVCPLLIFTPKLWWCRLDGLDRYMQLATHYVHAFDKKWFDTPPPTTSSLLGTADLQALADLSSSVNVIRNMRVLPMSSRTFFELLMAALLPALPLLLFKYPLPELVEKFISRLTGL